MAHVPHWLESFLLPLFMFPLLRDCWKGEDHGWARTQRLSADHGCGTLPTLEGLPAAFDAWLQASCSPSDPWAARAAAAQSGPLHRADAHPPPRHPPQPRRARLERAGSWRHGYALLVFFFRYNAQHSWALLAHTVAYIVLRCAAGVWGLVGTVHAVGTGTMAPRQCPTACPPHTACRVLYLLAYDQVPLAPCPALPVAGLLCASPRGETAAAGAHPSPALSPPLSTWRR